MEKNTYREVIDVDAINSEFGQIKKLFLKICFIFKQVNFDLNIPDNRSETVRLIIPRSIKEGGDQVGSIQYGGIKYPLNSKKADDLKYVELRLKGDFLKELDVFNSVYELLGCAIDANGWLKYKFIYSKEDIKIARKVSLIISSGMERRFGHKYLTHDIDKNIYDLPRIDSQGSTKTYDQIEAVNVISNMILEKGYNVSRSSSGQPIYHLVAESKGKSIKILVRHLQHDAAYKNSTLPYQVYKIDAFETKSQQTVGIEEIDLVVGYNFKDDSFACLEIKEFIDKRSRVVHEREGLKSEFYNSWHLLDKYFNCVSS